MLPTLATGDVTHVISCTRLPLFSRAYVEMIGEPGDEARTLPHIYFCGTCLGIHIPTTNISHSKGTKGTKLPLFPSSLVLYEVPLMPGWKPKAPHFESFWKLLMVNHRRMESFTLNKVKVICLHGWNSQS